MSEQEGIQFDDDSLLALFSKYDPEGTGRMVSHGQHLSSVPTVHANSGQRAPAVTVSASPALPGVQRYHELMRELLDDDTYRLWAGGHEPHVPARPKA